MFRYMLRGKSLIFVFFILFTVGCTPSWFDAEDGDGIGGGQDLVEVNLPFTAGYKTKCVQGPGGEYSHAYNSTRFDVDLDTPNTVDDPVYAPVSGTLYALNDPSSGFGIHSNIDIGDGSYINLSHMKEIFVGNGEEVASGQLLGFEGTTGKSTGDHVHMGRHFGSAYKDAGLGKSIAGLAIRVADGKQSSVVNATDMLCDLSWGNTYTSALATSKWHPNGSLVKTPSKSTVYLIEDEQKRSFVSEDVFWDRNYQFTNVALVDKTELDCYKNGSTITGRTEINAVYDGSKLWILVGDSSESGRYRLEVRSVGWQQVLETWGVHVEDMNDVYDESLIDQVNRYPSSGYAKYRDGSLIVGVHGSTVYLVSDGVAMPIKNRDTYLLMGFHDRLVVEVDDSAIAVVQGRVGSCNTNTYCIDSNDVTTCGGPDDTVDTDSDTDSDSDTDVDTDTETETDPDCYTHEFAWTPDNTGGEGEYLSGALYGHLWIRETDQWYENPAASDMGRVTKLVTPLYACSGDVFHVNGSFINFADVPHDGSGQWWMCADPWNARYWGSFSLDGKVLKSGSGLDVFSVDTDRSGGPSAGDEVGCRITVP